eukprot:m.147583 g.147583  ORF g.147583 m.147583 type:complete len:460 (-) comp14166_c1_seq1:200-1579(-)
MALLPDPAAREAELFAFQSMCADVQWCRAKPQGRGFVRKLYNACCLQLKQQHPDCSSQSYLNLRGVMLIQSLRFLLNSLARTQGLKLIELVAREVRHPSWGLVRDDKYRGPIMDAEYVPKLAHALFEFLPVLFDQPERDGEQRPSEADAQERAVMQHVFRTFGMLLTQLADPKDKATCVTRLCEVFHKQCLLEGSLLTLRFKIEMKKTQVKFSALPDPAQRQSLREFGEALQGTMRQGRTVVSTFLSTVAPALRGLAGEMSTLPDSARNSCLLAMTTIAQLIIVHNNHKEEAKVQGFVQSLISSLEPTPQLVDMYRILHDQVFDTDRHLCFELSQSVQVLHNLGNMSSCIQSSSLYGGWAPPQPIPILLSQLYFGLLQRGQYSALTSRLHSLLEGWLHGSKVMSDTKQNVVVALRQVLATMREPAPRDVALSLLALAVKKGLCAPEIYQSLAQPLSSWQ